MFRLYALLILMLFGLSACSSSESTISLGLSGQLTLVFVYTEN